MLQVEKTTPTPALTSSPSEILSPKELYTAFVAFVRRQFPVIASVLALTLGLAAIYIFTSPPRYTGEAVLIIDTHKVNLFLQQQGPSNVDMPIDTAMVDSQVEILKSENIALSFIKDLHLIDDPEFVGPSAGLVGTVVDFIANVPAMLFGSEP